MGSIVIGILLLVIVVGIVWKLRSDQKKGKHSCGGTCGGCPNAALPFSDNEKKVSLLLLIQRTSAHCVSWCAEVLFLYLDILQRFEPSQLIC